MRLAFRNWRILSAVFPTRRPILASENPRILALLIVSLLRRSFVIRRSMCIMFRDFFDGHPGFESFNCVEDSLVCWLTQFLSDPSGTSTEISYLSEFSSQV